MFDNVAVMIASAQTIALDAFARKALGPDAFISDDELPLSEVLDPLHPHACTFADHHWIFSWDQIEHWLTTPCLQVGTQSVYALNAQVGFYGFAIIHEGRMFRQRIGTERHGIVSDKGPLTEPEYETVASLFNQDSLNDGFHIWDGAHIPHRPQTHVSLGAEVVTRMLSLQTGMSLWQLSQNVRSQSARNIDFFEQPAEAMV